jgi:hypothetical protein
MHSWYAWSNCLLSDFGTKQIRPDQMARRVGEVPQMALLLFFGVHSLVFVNHSYFAANNCSKQQPPPATEPNTNQT